MKIEATDRKESSATKSLTLHDVRYHHPGIYEVSDNSWEGYLIVFDSDVILYVDCIEGYAEPIDWGVWNGDEPVVKSENKVILTFSNDD